LDQRSYTFDVEKHERQYSLLVDPTLLYSTFLGGSAGDNVTGIGVDGSGFAYIAGNTSSADFPTTIGAFQVEPYSSPFITKLNQSGSALAYSTYLGNNSTTLAAIAVDSSGHAYVAGETGQNFPTTTNAYWPTSSNQQCSTADFFISELDSTGANLVYSTCLNANIDGFYTHITAIAADGTGKAYLTGHTVNQLPTTATAYQTTYKGSYTSVFAMVIDTASSGVPSLKYSTMLNSSHNANSTAIAVDSFGKFYVTGYTDPGFSVTAGAFQTSHAACSANGGGDCNDAFISKLDPTASGAQSLIYSTYLGGSGSDAAWGIAVDLSGNAYLTGTTLAFNSDDIGSFPVTPLAYNTIEGSGAFVVKLNAGGSRLSYSTYLPGASPVSIAVDSFGDAYVTGTTYGGLPVTGDALQSVPATGGGNGSDAFLAELNSLLYVSPSGETVLEDTGIRSSADRIVDVMHAAGVKQIDHLLLTNYGGDHITGLSELAKQIPIKHFMDHGPALESPDREAPGSTDFPHTAGVLQPASSGGYDAFVAKIAPLGTALVYSTFLGGSGDDYALPIAVDNGGNVYITGDTTSTNFPVTADAAQPTSPGGYAAFVAILNSGGSALSYGTYLAGSVSQTGWGIALSPTREFIAAGYTASPDFPVTSGAFQPALAGATDAFVARFSAKFSPCDINADQSINVSDVQLIVNEALGVIPPSDDLNRDGVVNVSDVQIVINAALGRGCSVL
jgi:hypothetical protein